MRAAAISFSRDNGDVGCILDGAGRVQCTGYNGHGQRGVDGDVDQTSFTIVGGLPPIAEVAAAGEHVCVRGTDGTVWCWGRASEGETGETAYAAAAATTRAACAFDRPEMKRQAQPALARLECRRGDATDDCRPKVWIERDNCEVAYPPARPARSRGQRRFPA